MNEGNRVSEAAGYVAYRRGYSHRWMYVSRHSVPGGDWPEVKATGFLGDAMLFRSPADWEAFVGRVEAANVPLAHGLQKAGYRLAPARIEVDLGRDTADHVIPFAAAPLADASGD